MTDEITRLARNLPGGHPADPAALQAAGQALGIEWPSDYVSLMTAHNGVEGDVGTFGLVLTPAEELVEVNNNDVMEFFPGLVVIGGDGGGEALAIDRRSGEVLLVPWIGAQEDWLILGPTLTDALRRMDRGDVFAAPHVRRSRDIPRP